MGIVGDVEKHLVGPGRVVAVVHRAEVQVVPCAHAPLTAPGPLTQHEMIAAGGVGPLLDMIPDRHTVPVAWVPGAGEVGDGGAHIEVVVEAVLHAGGKARPRQHRGDVRGGLVGGHVVGVDAEFAEGLAVVAADEDGGIVGHAEIVELCAQNPNGVVGVADPDVVAVEDRLDVIVGRQVPRLSWWWCAPFVG